LKVCSQIGVLWPALAEPAPAHPRLLRATLLETVGADPAADLPVAAGSGARPTASRLALRQSCAIAPRPASSTSTAC